MASVETSAPEAAERLQKSVHQAPALSRAGLLERLFTRLFTGLVYAQIWEDPVVDMEGLALGPGKRIATISSGGCNALSYLTADPAEIISVDLNLHHVHLVRLKAAGLAHMPSYQSYYRFFGEANHRDNPQLYREFLRPHLPADTVAYWDGRSGAFRSRIGLFQRNIYHHGLLGWFIWAGHLGARVLGAKLEPLLHQPDLAAQRTYFETEIAPLFDHWLVRRITAQKASLFGLGIPPAQYDKLALEGGGDMAVVLRRRLEKLCCDFPASENYFLHQAFARRYAGGDGGPLPPYLQAAHFADLAGRADRVSVVNRSMTERLAEEQPESLDGYVLLDAQDWMTDAQLNAIWAEITRTAKPGARALFRTADLPSLLPGRLDPGLLDRWIYHEDLSADLTARDRSAIYGGVHVYERRP